MRYFWTTIDIKLAPFLSKKRSGSINAMKHDPDKENVFLLYILSNAFDASYIVYYTYALWKNSMFKSNLSSASLKISASKLFSVVPYQPSWVIRKIEWRGKCAKNYLCLSFVSELHTISEVECTSETFIESNTYCKRPRCTRIESIGLRYVSIGNSFTGTPLTDCCDIVSTWRALVKVFA